MERPQDLVASPVGQLEKFDRKVDRAHGLAVCQLSQGLLDFRGGRVGVQCLLQRVLRDQV